MKYLIVLICLFLSVFQGCQSPSEKGEKVPPNIILIYVDDMGLGDASFARGKVRPTPNIDRMAKGGKIFQKYYTNAPVCSPSRVAVTTGMYPLRWNINSFLSSRKHNDICDQSGFLDANAPSLARALQEGGYRTAHIGKWHMGGGRKISAPSITEYGFDEYVSTWESPDPDPLLTSSNWIWAPTDSIKRWDRTTYFVEKTLDFLKRNPETPCYINLWPDDVHSPWVPSEEAQNPDKTGYFSLPNLEPVITRFDQDMGLLLEGLEELGISEHTLIIFTSDNGPSPTFDRIRTNEIRGCKNSLYEGGINMPFFAYWPSVIKENQEDTTSLISAVDLFPSLCQIAGVPVPANWDFDGEDFSLALTSTQSFQRQADIYWEYGRVNPKMSIPKDSVNVSLPLAIRRGKWKFFCSFDGNQVELYNLDLDPGEQQNVSKEHPEMVDELVKNALKWFEENDKRETKKESLSVEG